MDVFTSKVRIKNEAPLQLGTEDASEIREIIHGIVVLDIPAVSANGAIASASGAVTGLTTSHRVFLMPQAWAASEQVIIAAAVGIAGGIQVTATNPHTASINPTQQTANFFAIRG